MKVQEIMTKQVVSLAPDTSVGEARDMLVQYRIHGAPVVDEQNRLVGMVSFIDLSAKPGSRVVDVMTVEPLVLGPSANVEDVASLMLDQMVRRVPIVEDGRVLGIVSASDIIQLFLNLHERVRDSHRLLAGGGLAVL